MICRRSPDGGRAPTSRAASEHGVLGRRPEAARPGGGARGRPRLALARDHPVRRRGGRGRRTDGRFVDAAVRHTAGTAGALSLIPLEDVLGQVEQPNLPGTIDEHPNWRRRLPGPRRHCWTRPKSPPIDAIAAVGMTTPRAMTSHAARDDAAAIAQGLHLRRCRGAGAVHGSARRQPSLCLADPDGAAGLDAWLRRGRPDARQSRNSAAKTGSGGWWRRCAPRAWG